MTVAPCQVAVLTPQDAFRQASGQVAVIELADEKDAALSYNSAIAIGGKRFATTCDLLAGVPKIYLVDGPLREPAALIQRDISRNLCVLETANLQRRASPTRSEPPQAGERVYAISNALGLGLGISEGVVSGVRTFGDATYIQFTAPIAPGSEGGGLFDGEGRLLGVIDYRLRDGQNVNFAAPASWIAEVGARQSAEDRRSAFRDKANALARQGQVQALLDLAKDWTAANPRDTEAWFWQAVAAEAMRDPGRAEQAYRELLRLDPESLKGRLGLARVLMQQGKNEEARTLARRLLTLRQEDADVWLLIGQAELALNNLGAAKEAFRRTQTLAPWAIAAYRGLANVEERQGDWDAAVGIWRQLTQLLPDEPWANLHLAEDYLHQKRPDRALALAERVLGSHPDDGDAWYWKGQALVALERPMAAIDAFQRSLARKPRSPAWVWSALADTNCGLKMWRECIAAHRESVKFEPDSVQWRWKLAVALKDSFEFDEAMRMFSDFAKAYPNDPAGWRQIGFVHAYRNEIPESVAALEHSLNLQPKQGQAWLVLTEQHFKAGRRDDMLHAYQGLRGVDAPMAEQAYLWYVFPTEVMP